jgi:hypothetical protein
MNQIIEVKLTLREDDWKIEVTKEFSPEYGGGSTVFTRSGGNQIHEALRRAAEMVTLTPAFNKENVIRETVNPDPPISHDYDAEGNPRRGRLGE